MTLAMSHKTYYIPTPINCWTTVTPMKRTKNRKPFLEHAKTARSAITGHEHSTKLLGRLRLGCTPHARPAMLPLDHQAALPPPTPLSRPLRPNR